MLENVVKFEKLLKKISYGVRKIEDMAKSLQKNAFTIDKEIDSCEKLLNDFYSFPQELKNLEEWLKERKISANSMRERFKAQLFLEIQNELSLLGLNLKGNFPSFTCGVLTIEIPPECKGDCKIYFGPKITFVSKCPINAKSISETIKKIYVLLDSREFSEEEFLKTLFSAYSKILKTENLPSSSIPIGRVMVEISILMQKKEFFKNPVRENYNSYGRMQFAYDMSRLNKKTFEEWELKLTVASMQQSKNPETNLWVPQTPRSEKGTHFSMLEFVKR